MKLPELTAVPLGVVTDKLPVVAPDATEATIVVEFVTLNEDAAVPPICTLVTPIKLVPVIVTEVPTRPDVGVKEVIVGESGNTIKLVPDEAIPPGVVTSIAPLEDPDATVAVIVVELTTVKEEAGVDPIFTEVVPIKLVPVIVTVVPDGPDPGVNEDIVGGNIIVKLPTDVEDPPKVVTLTVPVDVPCATTAVIVVELTTMKDAALVPPNVTEVAPVKLVPVIVTVDPIRPEFGVNELIEGGGTTVKLEEEVPVPPALVA